MSKLAELYTETIRLAAAGKINQKNTWSIRLIDYIDDLLSREKREADVKVTKSSSLFRKASLFYILTKIYDLSLTQLPHIYLIMTLNENFFNIFQSHTKTHKNLIIRLIFHSSSPRHLNINLNYIYFS